MALAFMRRHKKWLAFFLWLSIPALIVTFVALYIPTGETDGSGAGDSLVAKVGGERITAVEFQRAYRRQRDELQRMYPQGQLDAAMMERLGIREQTLQGLVERKLMALEAARLGLRVDDEALAHEIRKSPSLQENGAFIGVAEIRKRLGQAGISEEEFQESMRAELVAQRLQSVVTDGVAVSPSEVEREYRRRNERAKVEYVKVVAPATPPPASDAEAAARYQAKPDAYKLPERRVVSYALIAAEALRSRVTVTEAEIETYWRDHKDEFTTPEESCASHILVKVKAGPAAAAGHSDAEAKALAQAAVAQLKGGADFAAVAKKVSEDEGSATQGGDLGCFPRSSVAPEFANAAFSLPIGQVSEPVKTDFGYHVIRVASRQERRERALSEVKEGIRARLSSERTQALAQSQIQSMSAAIAGGRSLEAAAKELGIAVQKSAPLARGAAEPPLASAQLSARAFELKVGETAPEPFFVGPGDQAFIALAEVQAPRVPALAEVQAQVKADIARERAAEAARAQAVELRAAAARDGLDKAAVAAGLVRKETPEAVGRGQALGELGLTPALEQAVYDAPVGALSEPVAVEGGYALVRVIERQAFDAAAFQKEKDAITGSLREARKQQLFRAYMTQARERFPVERYGTLDRIIG
jgi:peptidyl-prolyl cis-trans isomerase D